MKDIRLNYKYRYPRVMFSNGEARYGMLYGIYNKAKKKLEYYFADSSALRKIDISNKELAFNAVKQLQYKIKSSDILRIQHLN